MSIDFEREVGVEIWSVISFMILYRDFFWVSDLINLRCMCSVVEVYCFIFIGCCIIVVDYVLWRIIWLKVGDVEVKWINNKREEDEKGNE